jgi:hypothetical protein
VAIDVLTSPIAIPSPSGYSGPGTYYVNIQLTPTPSFPLPAPGLTVVLPLASPMTPGNRLDLFRVDPATGLLVPFLDSLGLPILGSVDASGLSATFTGVVHLSTVVGLIPVVTRTTPTIMVTGGTFTYDGNAHPAAGTVTGAGGVSLGPLTFTYNGSSSPPVNAGTYAVLASFAGNSNYLPGSGSASIVINKAPLTVQADNKSKTRGSANPPFTATITGFVAGDSATSLTGTLVFTTTATTESRPGTYPITPGGVTSTNYAITFVNGTLTITKRKDEDDHSHDRDRDNDHQDGDDHKGGDDHGGRDDHGGNNNHDGGNGDRK